MQEMRMVLVHGINQEGKSAQIIHNDWIQVLSTNFGRNDLVDPTSKLSRIEAAFYGDDLKTLSGGWITSQAIALGAEEAPDDFDEFAVKALEEMALRIGVAHKQIEEEAATTTVAQGAGVHKKWLKAIGRVLEKVSPLRGTLALRVLGQAHAYIRNQYVHDEVNKLVRPLFDDDEPMIVVSHSLGTIVAYSLLREFDRNGRPREVPLFVTLGSPLGIDSVRRGFPKPRTRPAHVKRWVNGADPEDFVALQVALTDLTFGPGIINYSDFENDHANPHSISGYLSDKRIAIEIADAIT
jgi:hypothetical protein